MKLSYYVSRYVVTGLLTLGVLAASIAAYQVNPLTADLHEALSRISADSLRGHLSFIASDALRGRNTPSPGLEIASEYIAAQFRRAGLDPVGDDGYFQTANMLWIERTTAGFELELKTPTEKVEVPAGQVSFSFPQNLILESTPILRVDFRDAVGLDALTSAQVEGKVLFVEIPAGTPPAAQNEFLSKLRALKPVLIVSVVRNRPAGNGGAFGRLVQDVVPQLPPVLALQAPPAIALYDVMKAGETDATLSMRVPPLRQEAVKLRNVIGLLRGSDPTLRETYVMLTAHYDHVGVRPSGTGDRIFNGANDDGSGTVSVMEIAAALATLRERPRRSIVFMTVFGEERGLVGSTYYGRNPIFPIAKTVADINLEQVGRTDSTEGPQINTASLTGFDFSEVGSIFQSAGDLTGIRVYKHPLNSDTYFPRSDNAVLASLGVPAHSLTVAFNYPDYHGVDDEWEKIDYDNMARVDRMVALGLVMIANSPREPKWNEALPQTAPYVRAWKAQHP